MDELMKLCPQLLEGFIDYLSVFFGVLTILKLMVSCPKELKHFIGHKKLLQLCLKLLNYIIGLDTVTHSTYSSNCVTSIFMFTYIFIL